MRKKTLQTPPQAPTLNPFAECVQSVAEMLGLKSKLEDLDILRPYILEKLWRGEFAKGKCRSNAKKLYAVLKEKADAHFTVAGGKKANPDALNRLGSEQDFINLAWSVAKPSVPDRRSSSSTEDVTDSPKEPPPASGVADKPDSAAASKSRNPELEAKTKEARRAARRHEDEKAKGLWEEVRKQAEREGNKADEIRARLQIAVICVQTERDPTVALKVADACLRDATAVDLGKDRCRLLQLTGEIHRAARDFDQARGFLTNALELSRTTGSKGDEGFALVALSALKNECRDDEDGDSSLALIQQAYNCFSSLYTSGNEHDQENAKEGFAICHSFRAKFFGHRRRDDALAELTRALEIFRDMGEDWAWDVAQTLLCRADFYSAQENGRLAATDLEDAFRIFGKLQDEVQVAECYLAMGELLDAIEQRAEAEKYYRQAAVTTVHGNNQRIASKFLFRYACKLWELHKTDEAEKILIHLASHEGLDSEPKLEALSLLCMLAHGTKKADELKRYNSAAMSLIDDLIGSAKSATTRRKLTLKKGQHFEQLDQHEQALACYERSITTFKKIGDKEGVIECWFHIRGVMQAMRNRRKEREACEKVLSLTAETEWEDHSIFVGMTLVALAQLNISEQRFDEAREQLDQAEAMSKEPFNPAVFLVAMDLRTKLPPTEPDGQTPK